MKKYPFWQVDAFTNYPLGGNPCAVVLDADDLDQATMLAIARRVEPVGDRFCASIGPG